MKKFEIDPRAVGFKVLDRTSSSEVATMVIKPGDKEGGSDNKHDGDQWLFVLSGKGEATVEGRSVELKRGTLLEIVKGERHEIVNTGSTDLRTLNFYSALVF